MVKRFKYILFISQCNTPSSFQYKHKPMEKKNDVFGLKFEPNISIFFISFRFYSRHERVVYNFNIYSKNVNSFHQIRLVTHVKRMEDATMICHII